MLKSSWNSSRLVSSLALSVAIQGMGGCAHRPDPPKVDFRAERQKALNDLAGRDINDLIAAYGPPTSTYTMPNGDVLYNYVNATTYPGFSEPITVTCTMIIQAHDTTVIRARVQGC